MKGWRERAADIFAKHGEIAAKMKSAPGPGPTVLAPQFFQITPMPCLDKAASPAVVSKGIAADVFMEVWRGMDVACSAA